MTLFNFLHSDGTQYSIGAIGTGTTAMFVGLEVPASVGIAVILPALVMFLINLPKLVREAILLYREIRKPNSTRDTDSR